MTLAEAVRTRLLETHRPTLERALSCADAVAAGWDGETTTDRAAVVDRYRTVLREADALDPLVAALVDAVESAGGDLAAAPVADVPYLAVTGRGVVLRGTLVAGGRIVATLGAFEVAPYRRGPALPDALAVERRGR
ncbi:hypothetical protein [Natronomonas marina]|uniref:hypothetical protein n=1 Tax=Natronomonas marina TaxID=2961939 RepID=UPI0020C9D512|nr:hypothetical protein [Natronomonas marina]